MRMRARLLPLLASLVVLGCGGSDDPSTPTPTVSAVVSADRSGHLLDRPFPADELRTSEGTIDLRGFPLAGPSIGQTFMAGWLGQVRQVVRGFSALTPVYFRFDADPGLAGRYEGREDDPVRLWSLDSSHRVAVQVRWLGDSSDPYLPSGILLVAPDETQPLRPGERYAAAVDARVARRAPGWTPPAGLEATDAAVATVFTVQDHVAELRALRAAADAFLAADPDLLVPAEGLREVASLRFEQGSTPSGQPATLEVVTFADGGSEVTYLDDKRSAPDRTIDLTTGPMAVYQATIQTAAFQDPTGRPYQSPGLGIIFDTTRTDGWISFGPAGALGSTAHAEPLRIVVQVPRAAAGAPAVLLWAHGSGGDAYEAVARTEALDDIAGLRAALAQAGAVVLSLDQPLFGQRFPLIDRGYANNLAVVNIPNLPAFRDNVRQGAVDLLVLSRFARDVLPDLLQVDLDPARIRLFGHSIGAQIAGVAAAALGDDGVGAIMINGTGGYVTHSVLASDLLSLRGGDTAAAIFGLAGIPPPEDPTPAAILGALFGVPRERWDDLDRFHPLAIPFQLVVDAADPLPVAAGHDLPMTVFYGAGDTYVPPEGADWIARASRRGTLVPCTPATAYDGHVCLFREPLGRETLAEFATRPNGNNRDERRWNEDG